MLPMHFGVAFPSYVDAWRDAEFAEANGFTHAWFYDSQLIYSDVYATMALAAEHTSTMTLGTLVAIPSNRIAPVTAAAIATINALAPGRVVLGVGTGFTGRNTMGMPAIPVANMVEYVEQVRGLLAREDVLYKEGRYERWIRMIHPRKDQGFVNTDDPIPIHIAANAPKALAAVGTVGDGWITIAQDPAGVKRGLATIATAASRAKRAAPGSLAGGKPYTTFLTAGCILRDGERLDCERVLTRVGPVAVVAMHAVWETAHGGAGFHIDDPAGARAYGDYIEAIADRRGSPADRRYLDVHEGHMVFLKPGEEKFLAKGILPLLTLTGRPDEVLERVRALRDAGVDNLALHVQREDARELVEEFSRHVIAKL
jgi:5,10-methylenetetrahydromethanopterin reductase